jgi:iron complex outermembrane receptor protein
VQGLTDQGWRQQSPTRLARGYADLGWRHDGNELISCCRRLRTIFGVVAARRSSCCEGLDLDLHLAADDAEPEHLAALNGKFTVAENWTLQSNVYVRSFKQAHRRRQWRGRRALQQCVVLSEPALPRGRRVSPSDAGDDRVPQSVRGARPEQQSIPCPPGSGNTCAPVPYGTLTEP